MLLTDRPSRSKKDRLAGQRKKGVRNQLGEPYRNFTSRQLAGSGPTWVLLTVQRCTDRTRSRREIGRAWRKSEKIKSKEMEVGFAINYYCTVVFR